MWWAQLRCILLRFVPFFVELKMKRVVQAVAALALLVLVAPLWASDCAGMQAVRLAHTTIVRAEIVSAGSFTPDGGKPLTDLPPFCRVTAVAKPSDDSDIVIEIWMPASGWNHRLEGTGNGGFAGKISWGALAKGLRRGYAVANTDMGMATPAGATAAIFVNRPERWADWGYRATHEMTLAARQVVHAYYTQEPEHSYFVGCSTGGEQALMEAQRYPDDYDGIVGGAPAQNRTGVHVSILWNFVANERTPASRLPAEARLLLERAVIQACDGLDGVHDGLLTDPRQCTFDPAFLECKGASHDQCLTTAQVETAREIYAGPINPRTGQSLYPGLPKGSEFAWEGLDPIPGGLPPYGPIFQWVFGADWTWRQFDFDQQDTVFTQKLAPILNATNPDLDSFRKHGHKFLLYHGWSDWLVSPGETIRYYDAVMARDKARKDSRGVAPIDESLRLFMVPGMSHCAGGPGATHFDPLTAVVDWVERGVAPDSILATKLPPGASTGTPILQRPLCPYPEVAQYKGLGSMQEATNFACKKPIP